MRQTRTDSCPGCGASARQHTGSYCHACGESLLVDELEVHSVYKISPDEGPLADRVLTVMFRGIWTDGRLRFTGVRDTAALEFFFPRSAITLLGEDL